MSSPQTVLVTGGAGYIGSHTVVALHDAGHAPVIIDNFSNSKRGILQRIARLCGQEIPCFDVDCRDMDAMAEVMGELGHVQAVIHFAAYKAVGESVENPLAYYDNNIATLVNVLKLHQRYGFEGLVFSSSCTVYGAPDRLPVTESSPTPPAASPYGYTKQVGEQLIADYVHAGNALKAYTLRYFNPIGAHPSGLIGELPLGVPNNLVPYITQAAAGLRDRLRVFGNDYQTPDGTAIRDYIHVQDLARAHVMALEAMLSQPGRSHHAITNIGTGRGHSVLEAIEAFEKASGQALPYEFAPRRPGDVEAVWAGNDPDAALPGWKATLTLQDAMRDAWNWQKMLAQQPL